MGVWETEHKAKSFQMIPRRETKEVTISRAPVFLDRFVLKLSSDHIDTPIPNPKHHPKTFRRFLTHQINAILFVCHKLTSQTDFNLPVVIVSYNASSRSPKSSQSRGHQICLVYVQHFTSLSNTDTRNHTFSPLCLCFCCSVCLDTLVTHSSSSGWHISLKVVF